MILSLRQAIYKKMEPKSIEDLRETIEDAIDGDERALPGLGVLFEVLWKNIDKEQQDKMVDTIREHLPH
ncbi:small acid-soluble spore protein SspI [Paenibacillus antri]|uniref:Small, acid-soluble spore protein I n=1 Tax=Paenibacillus antri TaxID=2582848 RepID=A0A5R9GGK5_9BACL|nr:small acid-soluble spore protein SspI [Paenibacillus antri]TLS53300.1 small acid-soluble spore protein SspI [Paenibacillus antri]